MRRILLAALLAAPAGLAGCGETAPANPTGPITLTKEQSEAIAKGDDQVLQEEGGAFLAKTAKSRKR